MYSSLTILTLVTMTKMIAERTNVLGKEPEDTLRQKDRNAKHESFNTTIEQVECIAAVKRSDRNTKRKTFDTTTVRANAL